MSGIGSVVPPARRGLVIFVVGAMLSLVAGATGAASPQQSHLAAQAPPENAEVAPPWNQYANVWRNSDGTHTAEISTRPMYYEKADGSWAPIDPTLRATSEDGYAWRNVGGPLELRFAQVATSERIASVETDTGSIAFSLEGGASTSFGIVQGSEITYANVLPGVDLVYQSREDTLKELIVLEEAPEEPVSFSFSLSLRGLTPRPEADGAISLLDASGKVALFIPAASMTDSNVDPQSAEPAFSEDVDLELAGKGGEYLLTVTPDLTWLQDPERVYPVEIDPTVTAGLTGDTFVQTGIASSQAGSDELKAGTFDGGATKARSLLRFDISSVRDKHILSATLSLYEWHSWSCSAREVKARRVDSNWSGATVNWADQPDYASTAFDILNVAKGFSGSCPDGWINLDATTPVRQWANDTYPNHGIMVRADDESDDYGWKKFRSKDYGDGSRAPKLVVTYNSYPDLPTSPSPVGGVISSDETPTLSATYNDDDAGDAGRVDYQVCANPACAASDLLITGSGSGASPGQASSWTVPSATLEPGQEYWWRSQGNDGVDVTVDAVGQPRWTTPRAYIVDGPPQAPEPLSPLTDDVVVGTTPQLDAIYIDADSDEGWNFFEILDETCTNVIESGSGTQAEHVEESNWVVPANTLATGDSYGWRVRSWDGSAWSAYSECQVFRVVSEVADESPADESVSTNLEPTLSARLAEDAAGPDALTFTVRRISDGVEVASGAGSMADPGELSAWQVPASALEEEGDYFWYAESSNGGRSSDSRYITVEMGPQVGLLSPLPEAVIGESVVALRASPVGFQSVSRVEFFVDNSEVAEVTTAPYEAEWEIPSATGAHEFKAIAHGTAGGQTTSATSRVIEVTYSEGDMMLDPSSEPDPWGEQEPELDAPSSVVEPTPVDTFTVAEATNPQLSAVNSEEVDVRKWRIRQYAHRYVFNDNPRYYRFSNDCTNFVSQALRYAGWPFSYVNDDFADKRNWWYHRPLGSYHERTHSWSVTPKLKKFFTWSGRVSFLSNLWQVQVGDIIFIDWRGPNVDGVNPTHAMIVTGTPNRGMSSQNILLTYHSNDRKDRPWKGAGGIQQDWPNATLWAYRVKYYLP